MMELKMGTNVTKTMQKYNLKISFIESVGCGHYCAYCRWPKTLVKTVVLNNIIQSTVSGNASTIVSAILSVVRLDWCKSD